MYETYYDKKYYQDKKSLPEKIALKTVNKNCY